MGYNDADQRFHRSPADMQTRRRPFRRLKLRTVLLIALLLSGIIPLGISSALLIPQSERILLENEQENLIQEAAALSREINAFVVAARRQLTQFGTGILTVPGPPETLERLAEPWVGSQLQSFRQENPDLRSLRLLDLEGRGLEPPNLSAPERAAMDAAFAEAKRGKATSYHFVDTGPNGKPLMAVAVPVRGKAAEPRLVVEGLLLLRPLEEVFQAAARQGIGVFLLDAKGRILWSNGGGTDMRQALSKSEEVRSLVSRGMNGTTQYTAPLPAGEQEVLAQVSALAESGWSLVVQKPLSAAFQAVSKMIFNAALSSVLLVALALFFAYLTARWVSLPIQRLAETTHEVAEGNFGGQVEMKGLTFELADLAEDFNRMSGHVESYVQQLRQAAQANRDLFIGSLRAFVAAVDAKDPYTRGHSERVASFSRTIARYLQLPEEVQHKIWIGALLHDVGKIGVEDRILRKEGVLAPDEYEQMKMHTVMGADIMTPIEQLKEMIPAIRWHHEAWNGRGYPDGLKGEQIPLFARIVAVADTFDAITTNRPYQQAYDLRFAVETITRLTGSRFDAKIVTAFLRAFEAGEIRAGEARPARPEAPPLARAAAQR
jgi:putative nucleotidyltransferase with HDIG domain